MLAPSAAAASTIASPIPLLPPVTTIDLPSSSTDTSCPRCDGRSLGAPAPPPRDQVGDEPRPTRLVGGAETGTRLAVEVLVERDQVVPRGVALEEVVASEDRPRSVGALHEDRDEARRELVGHLLERQMPAGASRALDDEVVAEVAVVHPQRLQQEVVDGEPNRSAPVRVAAEEARRRLARFVVE